MSNLTVVAREVVPVTDLTHFDGNPRRHNLQVIAASLKANGQYRDIVVRKHDDPNKHNVVLAGNGTLEAARDVLGWTHIAVGYVEVDDAQARRIVLVDNRANDLASYDDGDLANLLRSLDGDYAGSGYSEDDRDLVKLLASLADKDEDGPLVEFSLALMESQNYLVLAFDNDLDWNAACQHFGVKTVKAWDAKGNYQRMGIGRVLNGGDYLKTVLA